ncbi:MAG: 16S rRNA (guanine(527)-N(7))-methyltransferase RsmG [Deltaproteobacteria bacterium]|nr:16S rRNA (guanine(527)-N(7))-methyltransferase RsmG [Deltaproteobacteria bacterium]
MWREDLIAGARLLGLELTTRQVEQFAVYLHELKRWNKTYNLTTITEPLEVVSKHFLDSLNYLAPLDGVGEVLDLGSGPGFPGLPLAIVLPKTKFTLVEARRKKTIFLTFVSRQLNLENVEIIHLHLSRGNARTVFERYFPVIVSRAVTVLRDVVPVASDLLAADGCLLFTNAHPDRQEIEQELGKWPDLFLEKLEKTRLAGRAPDLYIGIIRKRVR